MKETHENSTKNQWFSVGVQAVDCSRGSWSSLIAIGSQSQRDRDSIGVEMPCACRTASLLLAVAGTEKERRTEQPPIFFFLDTTVVSKYHATTIITLHDRQKKKRPTGQAQLGIIVDWTSRHGSGIIVDCTTTVVCSNVVAVF